MIDLFELEYDETPQEVIERRFAAHDRLGEVIERRPQNECPDCGTRAVEVRPSEWRCVCP